MPCWYYEKEDFETTPSVKDGIDPGTEARYRREGSRFIIEAGTTQGLRYDTMATGVVYFHRFYMFHSFKEFPRYIMGAACLFLAGKVEETPKKCKDIIKIAKNILSEQHFAAFGDDPKEEIMTHERILLQTIKFDLQVEHPYSYLLKYAKTFKGDKDKIQKLVQMAWTFVNDSLCTTLCLQWEPHIVAVGFFYLAGRLSKSDLMDWSGKSNKVKWWEQLTEDASLDIMEEICHKLLDLYAAGQKKGTPGTPPKAGAPQKRPKPKSEGEEHGGPKAKAIKQEPGREKQRPPPPPPPATHATQPPASHPSVSHPSQGGHQPTPVPPPPPRTQSNAHAASIGHSQLPPSNQQQSMQHKTLLETPQPQHPQPVPPPVHKIPQQAPHQVPQPVPPPTQHQPVAHPVHHVPQPVPPPHTAQHQAPVGVPPPVARPTMHPAPHPAPHHIPHQAPHAPVPQQVPLQHHKPPLLPHPQAPHPQPAHQAPQPVPVPVPPPGQDMHRPPYQQVPGYPPQKPPATTYGAPPHYSTHPYTVASAPQPGMPHPSQAVQAPVPSHSVHPHQHHPGQVPPRPPPPPVAPPGYSRPPPATSQPIQYQHPPPTQAPAPPHQVMYRPPPPQSIVPVSVPGMPPTAPSVPQYAPHQPLPSQVPPPHGHYQPPPPPTRVPPPTSQYQPPTTQYQPPTTQYQPHTAPISHPSAQQHHPMPRSQPLEPGSAYVGVPQMATPAPPRGMVPHYPPPPTTVSQAPPAKQPPPAPGQPLPADLHKVDESMLKIAKHYAAQQIQQQLANLGMPRNMPLGQVPGSSSTQQQHQQQAPPGLSAQAPGAPGQQAQGGYSSGLATVRITGRERGRRPSHGSGSGSTNKRR